MLVEQKLFPSPTLHIELSKEIEEVFGGRRKSRSPEKWCSFPTMEHAIYYGSSTDLFTFLFWQEALSLARLQRLDLIDFIGEVNIAIVPLIFIYSNSYNLVRESKHSCNLMQRVHMNMNIGPSLLSLCRHVSSLSIKE